MIFFRFLTVGVLFFSVVVSTAFAQNKTDEQTLKQNRKIQLLEQVLADIPNLKLPENRAYLYAQAGKLLWTLDEKRARTILQNSIGELLSAQNQAEADKKNNSQNWDLLTSQNSRPSILELIGSCDADLALDAFFKTRPSKIVKALAGISEPGNPTPNLRNDYYLVQTETNLEEKLTALAAEQNPQRAIKLLKESLKKNLGSSSLSLLQKLFQKEPETANELAGEILQKLLKPDYDVTNPSRNQYFYLALSFINEFIREKAKDEKFLKLDESLIRNLADLIITSSLKNPDRNYGYEVSSILPIAQKLVPSRVTALKNKQAEYNRQNPFSYNPEANEILQSDAAPEKLISEAERFPPYYRQQFYVKAAQKYVEQGNSDQAQKTLADHLSDDELDNAMASFNWQMATGAISEGKFDEAMNYINQLPESAQINSLLYLATSIYQKNPGENKSRALSVLGQARRMISETPEDSTEMAQLFQLISTCVAIEPGEAFRLFEPVVPQLNQLWEAASVLNSFTRNGNVRQGEFLMIFGNSAGLYVGELDSVINYLKAADFDRTTKIIDSFQKPEIRLMLRLKLAETILN